MSKFRLPISWTKLELLLPFISVSQRTPKAEVLSVTGKVIPGLYAAGEATGGVHGAVRLGSNAVTDCVANGRIAGREVSR